MKTQSLKEFPIPVDRIINDTQHMNIEARGAYLKLMYQYWTTLPRKIDAMDPILSKFLGISLYQWKKIRPFLFSAGFTVHKGNLHHPLIEKAYIELIKKRDALQQQSVEV